MLSHRKADGAAAEPTSWKRQYAQIESIGWIEHVFDVRHAGYSSPVAEAGSEGRLVASPALRAAHPARRRSACSAREPLPNFEDLLGHDKYWTKCLVT